MHILKKHYSFFVVILVSTAVLLMSLYLAVSNETKPDKTADQVRADAFMDDLEPYLPIQLTSEMAYHEARHNTDGTVLFHWAKKISPETAELQCSLQVVMADESLISFHYKDYGYRENRIQSQSMSKQAASELVSAFAKTYIEAGAALQFENRPAYWSLYEPDKVESWVAVRGDKEYLVMVDLVYGYVVYAGVVSSPDTYIINTTLK